MSRVMQIALLVVLGIGTYVSMSAVYTVSEVEQMIITQFGKPVGAPVTSAGLKLKMPFIQDVNPIDKRVLEWDRRHEFRMSNRMRWSSERVARVPGSFAIRYPRRGSGGSSGVRVGITACELSRFRLGRTGQAIKMACRTPSN